MALTLHDSPYHSVRSVLVTEEDEGRSDVSSTEYISVFTNSA